MKNNLYIPFIITKHILFIKWKHSRLIAVSFHLDINDEFNQISFFAWYIVLERS